MPQYFFDTQNGGPPLHDETGLLLENDEAARREALFALPNIARDEMPDGDRRTFTCSVRNERGRTIFVATLSLAAEWIR